MRYQEAGGGYWAAAVALNLLLSLFPILLAILFIASLVLRDHSARDNALHQIARVIPGGRSSSAFDDLTSAIDGVRERTGLLGVVGIAGLLWSGSGLFGAIEAAFGAIYKFRPRDLVRGKLMAFGLILVFAVCVVIGIGASAALAVLTPIAERSGSDEVLAGPVRWVIQVGIGMITGLVLFGLIYSVVPRGRRRWSTVLPGATLAALAFELLNLAWPLYLSLAGGGNRYGQFFGLLLVVVAYVYLMAQILMLGAALNSTIEEQRHDGTPPASGEKAMTGYTGASHGRRQNSASLCAPRRARRQAALRWTAPWRIRPTAVLPLGTASGVSLGTEATRA
jgi:membrane protein